MYILICMWNPDRLPRNIHLEAKKRQDAGVCVYVCVWARVCVCVCGGSKKGNSNYKAGAWHSHSLLTRGFAFWGAQSPRKAVLKWSETFESRPRRKKRRRKRLLCQHNSTTFHHSHGRDNWTTGEVDSQTISSAEITSLWRCGEAEEAGNGRGGGKTV